jgi:soluble lytic murein transglycosylase-like protein
MKAFILALAIVESSMNPSAVGDGGDAVGLLQIHECVIQDVNRVYGTGYTAEDRKDPRDSVAICTRYIAYWGKHYTKLTGQPLTYEVCAKIWNGGAYGWRKTGKVGDRLDAYWEKVSAAMRTL